MRYGQRVNISDRVWLRSNIGLVSCVDKLQWMWSAIGVTSLKSSEEVQVILQLRYNRNFHAKEVDDASANSCD